MSAYLSAVSWFTRTAFEGGECGIAAVHSGRGVEPTVPKGAKESRGSIFTVARGEGEGIDAGIVRWVVHRYCDRMEVHDG